MIYQGSCHCQAITFKVEAPENIEVDDCNCSICHKSDFLHLIVPLSQFKLLSGQNHQSTYTFNTGIAKHTFCGVYGIKPFYTPRSNPDGIDINVNCFDARPRSIKPPILMIKIGKNIAAALPIRVNNLCKHFEVAGV